MEETARRSENGLFFYLLDDPESMIRVNDLVTNRESHVSLDSSWYVMAGMGALTGDFIVAETPPLINGNAEEIGHFRKSTPHPDPSI